MTVCKYRRRMVGWGVVMLVAWLGMLASHHLLQCGAAYVTCLAVWAFGLGAWAYSLYKYRKETK